jgi:hypothetical protein
MSNVAHVAHLLHCSVTILNIILKHLEVFVSSLHEVKNFVTVEIRQARPFVNSHFHFVVTVELVTSRVLFQWPIEVILQHDTAT